MALGIGSFVAVASKSKGVILPAQPIPEPERLVVIYDKRADSVSQTETSLISGDRAYEFSRRSNSLEALASYRDELSSILIDGLPHGVLVGFVSGNYFDVVRVKPAIGRLLRASDAQHGPHNVILLNYHTWQRRFGGDTNIIGKIVRIGKEECSVVGVLPREFRPIAHHGYAEIYRPDPQSFFSLSGMAGNYYFLIGRLRPTVHVQQLIAELATIQVTEKKPFAWIGETNVVFAAPIQPTVFPETKRTHALFLGVVIMLLVATCINAANLILARLWNRKHEWSIRLALGASILKLWRLVIVECFLVVLLAASGGTLFAHWLFPVLSNSFSGPRETNIQPIAYVIAGSVSLVVWLVISLCMLVFMRRINPTDSLSGDPTAIGQSRKHTLFQQLMMVAQAGLTTVLVIGTCLMIKSVRILAEVPLGFDLRNRYCITFTKFGGANPDEARGEKFDRLAAQLAAQPGVLHVAGTMGALSDAGLELQVRPADAFTSPIKCRYQPASANFLSSIGATLTSGEYYKDGDKGVAVINQTMAKSLVSFGEPLGAYFILPSGESLRVIGITRDILTKSPRNREAPTFYAPSGILGATFDTILIVTKSAITEGLARNLVHAVYLEYPDTNVGLESLEAIVQRRYLKETQTLRLLKVASLLGLGVTLTGMFSTQAYQVSLRRREYGLQLALGSQPSRIVMIIVRRGLLLTLAGMAIGWIVAYWLSAFFANIIYESSVIDRSVVVYVITLFFVVSVIGSILPGYWASRTSPSSLLRSQ